MHIQDAPRQMYLATLGAAGMVANGSKAVAEMAWAEARRYAPSVPMPDMPAMIKGARKPMREAINTVEDVVESTTKTVLTTLGENIIVKGFTQLARTLRGMGRYKQTLTFLIAYLIYNDAIQAVITLAGQYGSDYLKIPMESLTLAILMVQFVAFGGALAFNYLAQWMTAYRAVMLSLVIWTLLMCGVFLVKTTAHYFIAAALVAVVMGGSQALSRSLYSDMIPRGK